jgi:site-specific DNA recombinase
MPKKRACAYVRVSLDRTGESQSPERQEDECRRLAAGRGWELTKVYADRNLSAFKKNVRRPGYEAMLTAVRAGAVDVVVVYSMSRLARSTQEVARILDLLGQHGCALASCSDPVDTSTASGRAMTQMSSVFAELEAALTQERVMSAHDRNARLGKMHGGGSRRFGYTRQSEVVPDEAAIVREVYERALTGESFYSLARDLNERDVRTTTGRQWYARTVKQMVTAPHVAGQRVHTVRRDGRVISRDVYPGTWEPILTPAEHARLLEAVTRTPAARRSVRRHLLTGLATCGVCGGAMKTTGFRMHNGKPFERYACVKQPGHDNCGHVAVTKLSLDAYVTGQVLDYVARSSMATGGESTAQSIEDLERQLDEDDRALTELTMARFVHRTIPPVAFETTQAELNERRSQTEARLVELRRLEDERARALRPGDRAALQAWWDGASVEEQRAALRGALHEVRVNRAARRGGNRFDTSRVELRWRLDFYARAADARWSAMTDDERTAAAAAYEAAQEAAGDPAEGWPDGA